MFGSDYIFFPRCGLFLPRFLSTLLRCAVPLSLFIIFSATLSVPCSFPYFSLLKSWPSETVYTMHSLSWSLFYPLSCDHPRLSVSLILKLHAWHEIHQGEGVQKLYMYSVILSLSTFPIIWNSEWLHPLFLCCCCYFCCYVCFSSYNNNYYSNLKGGGEMRRRLMKKRDPVNIGRLGRQSLGQHYIALAFLTLPCPTHSPPVWHPTYSEH